jgi:hypothetical protein
MIESEAKTKWCPMVRIDGNTNNRSREHVSGKTKIGQAVGCFGSSCMARRRSVGQFHTLRPMAGSMSACRTMPSLSQGCRPAALG